MTNSYSAESSQLASHQDAHLLIQPDQNLGGNQLQTIEEDSKNATDGLLENGRSDSVMNDRGYAAFKARSQTTSEGSEHSSIDPPNQETSTPSDYGGSFQPVAVCGMACRLPGGIHSPSDLWSFLHDGRDARGPVPASRYNISAYHSPDKKPGHVIAQQGYFLDSSNDLAALDTSMFSMPRREVETLDPQQRLLLEVSREALDDAGETAWKGTNVGVYVGSYGQDWYDMSVRDTQAHGMYQVLGPHDFMVSNRISYELDLHGPSMTVRTACSASLIGINEACMAMARGDCTSAIVGGSNLIMAPALTAAKSEQGVLSPDGSCNTFSANANGYARGEGIVAIYLKPLDAALRDGNPVRAVVTGTAINHNGHTSTVAHPSSRAQEALIRQAYRTAGIPNIAKTGYFECHGTGTRVGDPLEAAAVAACFGSAGVHIGSIKANLGHAEGAAGLVGVLKAVLALENRTIPPSIKSLPLNPDIPFADANLVVPTEPIPWPQDREERVSVNSFGLGGSNAHAIIESADRFNVLRRVDVRKTSSSAPHLLLFSANTQASLKMMSEKFETYLNRQPHLLSDVAYTLANRREALQHRTFAVCTSEQVAPAAPPLPGKDQLKKDPSVVMIFTGQGAQWARMGFEFLRSEAYPVFRNTISLLDEALQELGPLAPSWSISEELRKPARKSRVDEAEICQPLCTALQIALVDLYSSVGVRPAAVLGHSSGEIAAAYAAGGLSAREAIVVAFLRGLVTTRQKRKGAMGALGMSWESAKEHLIPGVVVACENAPNSVTISGDAEQVETIINSLKQSGSGVLATLLKVEKAYHSPHMAENGAEYLASMTDAGVVGTAHNLPFFSSVSGKFLEPNDQVNFGPKYWQSNLEQPVLFSTAVQSAIAHCASDSRQIFLEVGPHSALAGPVRQILTQSKSDAAYIPSLTRRTDSVESWLTALGQLFVQRAAIDFESLMKGGSTIPDLPSYAWDHHQSHWSESRISQEWRQRKFAHHDLLGAKVPDTTDLEPVWRNLLHVDHAPWIRDHKIDSDVIFPFAAYIAMAAEAIRQITGVEEMVELRNVAVRTALVINDGAPKELVTSFHRLQLTDSLESEWWRFSISSHNGHTWTKHCVGEIQARHEDSEAVRLMEHTDVYPRHASRERWYETMRREGLDYGYHFRCMDDIRATTVGARQASARVRNNWHGDERFYHLHPVILDSFFQLLSIAVRRGLTHEYQQVIPASVGSLILRRSAKDDLDVRATATPAGSGVHGEGSVTDGRQAIIEISGVRLASFTNGQIEESPPITARSEWVPLIETSTLSGILKPSSKLEGAASNLEEYARLSIILAHRSLTEINVALPLTSYKAWLDSSALSSSASELDLETLKSRLDELRELLAAGSTVHISEAIDLVSANMSAILSGQEKASELLELDDTLGKLTRSLESFEDSQFLKQAGHEKPNLRVLELGAGIGSMTKTTIESLTRPDGQSLFSSFVVSDPSPGMVEALKARFQAHSNVTVEILDIGTDVDSQGFEERGFDLIIAAGILHRTPDLAQALLQVRKLLKPSGRLLLQSLRPSLLWARYVLGLLPEWHIGTEAERAQEPYVDAGRWKDLMGSAGLEICNESAPENQQVSNVAQIIVARPIRAQSIVKKITILSEAKPEDLSSNILVKELSERGFDLSFSDIASVPPPGQDIVALLDADEPYVSRLDADRFYALKKFIDNVVDAGILWITQPTNGTCADPAFAQIHGLARCIRSELGLHFATCEADAKGNLQGSRKIADVVELFLNRVNDDEIEPDFEYVVDRDSILVNRFFPVAEAREDAAADDSLGDVRLTVDQPGRLDTLHFKKERQDTPQGNDVQVEVHAVGLNFRDVLVAMGIIELTPPTFGYEATGIVRSVGPRAEKLRVGDRVALVGYNVFASTTTTSETLCEKLPEDLSFTDGASMPLVFATTIYSLINVARLENGQSILIHSGCGGVGLAAIQLARMIGAEIYTTVSSEKKIAFLESEFKIPRDHIFNSRSVTFEQDLLKATKNRGVDVALNSLSGEMLHATWRCIAKWGTLVEIGKRDLLGAAKLDMEIFLANRSYRCVDIDAMCKERPEMIASLLKTMMSLFRDGHIRPITVDKIFSGLKTQEAFQYMQQGQHIGKIIVDLREQNTPDLQCGPISSSSSSNSVSFDPSASYLLVGGLGGLGRSVSVWMVQRGARHLTFLSRSAGSTEKDQLFVHEIQSMGCEAVLVRGSVDVAEDVASAVAKSPKPIKGVLQMSMALHDQSWRNMTIADWHGATTAKVQGTWNLHHETLSQPLDFFVLFSSLSGIIGQPGQANYASANTFLDAFVPFRTGQNLPCTALNIGAVEGAGYLTRDDALLRKMKGTGWRAVQEAELLGVLGSVMRPPAPSTAASTNNNLINPHNTLVGIAPSIPLSDPSSSAALRADIRMSIFRNTRQRTTSTTASSSSSTSLQKFLLALKADPTPLHDPSTTTFLTQEIGTKLLSLVLRATQDAIDPATTLAQLGLDSMVAVEMRAWWKQMFGGEVSVLEMLSVGTVGALGERAVEGLRAMYA